MPDRAQWNASRHIFMSFVFAIFAPAHHHPRLSRIIYPGVIYVEFGFQHFFLWFIAEIHGCQAFWASKDLGSDSAFCLDWAESDALKPFQTCFFFFFFFFHNCCWFFFFFFPPLHFVWSLAAGHSPWRIASAYECWTRQMPLVVMHDI